MTRRTVRMAIAGIVAAGVLAMGMVGAPAMAVGTASISGNVTVPSGQDPTQIEVDVYASSDSNTVVSAGSVLSDGTYSVTGLAAGSYRVFFNTANPASIVAPEWWDDASDFSAAQTIALANGQNAVASATLSTGASISGTLSPASTVSGEAGVCVIRVIPNTGVERCSGMAGSDGSYAVGGLRAGTYKVQIWMPPGCGGWLPWSDTGWWCGRALWWSDQLTGATATPLTLTAGQQATGIDEDVSTTGGKSTFPTITGTAKVGVKLTATSGAWPTGTQLKYYWYAGGAYVSGATGTTFTPTAAQLGKNVGVDVFGLTTDPLIMAPGAWQAQHFTVASKVVAGTLTAPTPTISGTRAVGFTLTAKPGTWTSGTALSYAWYANDVYITGSSGATHSTFKLTSAQQGKRITVKVTGKKAGYTTVSKTSAHTAKVALTATPTISGTRTVGYPLTAHHNTWTSGTTFTYRWYASGTAITGATSSTLKLTSSLRGKSISVKVTGSLPGYSTVTRASAPTSKIV